MNQKWKYLLIIAFVVIGFLYSIPNIYGEDPSVQISTQEGGAVAADFKQPIENALANANLTYKSFEQDEDTWLIRFRDTDDQLKAKGILKATLGNDMVVALNLAPATPLWLEKLGANPMKLGLDLRGGVHFLLEVDVDGVIAKRQQGMMRDISQELRNEGVRYAGLEQTRNKQIIVQFKDGVLLEKARSIITRKFPSLEIYKSADNGVYELRTQITPAGITEIRSYTLEQTMTTLRNRVNELGVSEAVVQRQGATRVAVDLPGIQDSARAKQILGGTATLEFRMVDDSRDARNAELGGAVVGAKLYQYQGRPVLLKNQIILSGDAITGAVASFDDSGKPSANIRLGGGGESLFYRTTSKNIGKSMAIVYVEAKTETKMVDGKPIKSRHKQERVISVATIQSALGTSFQITGLSSANEARNLTLLLRAGALPASIEIVEERTVGASLGKENIQKGVFSLEIGMLLIVILMGLYYRFFGLVADVALVLNLVLIIAIMSLIGATMTLPGIAGVILTVGMAVDANVLIFERVREEVRNGVSPQSAIHAGYERAFNTIVDANVTTLIVAMVLFGMGSGAIKAFAITITIGLLTSMFTAITVTRGIVNLVYGGKAHKKLSIGI